MAKTIKIYMIQRTSDIGTKKGFAVDSTGRQMWWHDPDLAKAEGQKVADRQQTDVTIVWLVFKQNLVISNPNMARMD